MPAALRSPCALTSREPHAIRHLIYANTYCCLAATLALTAEGIKPSTVFTGSSVCSPGLSCVPRRSLQAGGALGGSGGRSGSGWNITGHSQGAGRRPTRERDCLARGKSNAAWHVPASPGPRAAATPLPRRAGGAAETTHRGPSGVRHPLGCCGGSGALPKAPGRGAVSGTPGDERNAVVSQPGSGGGSCPGLSVPPARCRPALALHPSGSHPTFLLISLLLPRLASPLSLPLPGPVLRA